MRSKPVRGIKWLLIRISIKESWTRVKRSVSVNIRCAQLLWRLLRSLIFERRNINGVDCRWHLPVELCQDLCGNFSACNKIFLFSFLQDAGIKARLAETVVLFRRAKYFVFVCVSLSLPSYTIIANHIITSPLWFADSPSLFAMALHCSCHRLLKGPARFSLSNRALFVLEGFTTGVGAFNIFFGPFGRPTVYLIS